MNVALVRGVLFIPSLNSFVLPTRLSKSSSGDGASQSWSCTTANRWFAYHSNSAGRQHPYRGSTVVLAGTPLCPLDYLQ